jgi:hypothetical protein
MADPTPQQLALYASQLAAIDAAIASGALRVDYPDRGQITYRSLLEMRQIRQDIISKMTFNSSNTPTRRVVMTPGSGW